MSLSFESYHLPGEVSEVIGTHKGINISTSSDFDDVGLVGVFICVTVNS